MASLSAQVEEELLTGHLSKRGRFIKAWKRRFFVLTTLALRYYTNVGGALKGEIELKPQSAALYLSEDLCFQVVTGGRTLVLQARDEAERRRWVDAITGVIRQQQYWSKLSNEPTIASDMAGAVPSPAADVLADPTTGFPPSHFQNSIVQLVLITIPPASRRDAVFHIRNHLAALHAANICSFSNAVTFQQAGPASQLLVMLRHSPRQDMCASPAVQELARFVDTLTSGFLGDVFGSESCEELYSRILPDDKFHFGQFCSVLRFDCVEAHFAAVRTALQAHAKMVALMYRPCVFLVLISTHVPGRVYIVWQHSSPTAFSSYSSSDMFKTFVSTVRPAMVPQSLADWDLSARGVPVGTRQGISSCQFVFRYPYLSLSGTLAKRGQLRIWHDQQAILTGDRFRCFAADLSQERPSLDLAGASVEALPPEKAGRANAFAVTQGPKAMWLAAKSDMEAQRWIRAFTQAAFWATGDGVLSICLQRLRKLPLKPGTPVVVEMSLAGQTMTSAPVPTTSYVSSERSVSRALNMPLEMRVRSSSSHDADDLTVNDPTHPGWVMIGTAPVDPEAAAAGAPPPTPSGGSDAAAASSTGPRDDTFWTEATISDVFVFEGVGVQGCSLHVRILLPQLIGAAKELCRAEVGLESLVAPPGRHLCVLMQTTLWNDEGQSAASAAAVLPGAPKLAVRSRGKAVVGSSNSVDTPTSASSPSSASDAAPAPGSDTTAAETPGLQESLFRLSQLAPVEFHAATLLCTSQDQRRQLAAIDVNNALEWFRQGLDQDWEASELDGSTTLPDRSRSESLHEERVEFDEFGMRVTDNVDLWAMEAARAASYLPEITAKWHEALAESGSNAVNRAAEARVRLFLRPTTTAGSAAKPRSSLENVESRARMRGLVRIGIPPWCRSRCWSLHVLHHQQANIPPDIRRYLQTLHMEDGETVSYDACVSKWVDLCAEHDANKHTLLRWPGFHILHHQISVDLPRTLGGNSTVLNAPGGAQVLARLLGSYAARNPAVGYCQSMNFIASMLYMALRNEPDTFRVLSGIVEVLCPAYHVPSMIGIHVDCTVTDILLQEVCPGLHRQLTDCGLSVELVITEWLLCVFSTQFPTSTLIRLWDLILFEGSEAVIAATLAHLVSLAPILAKSDDLAEIMTALKNGFRGCHDATDIVESVLLMLQGVTRQRIASLRMAHWPQALEWAKAGAIRRLCTGNILSPEQALVVHGLFSRCANHRWQESASSGLCLPIPDYRTLAMDDTPRLQKELDRFEFPLQVHPNQTMFYEFLDPHSYRSVDLIGFGIAAGALLTARHLTREVCIMLDEADRFRIVNGTIHDTWPSVPTSRDVLVTDLGGRLLSMHQRHGNLSLSMSQDFLAWCLLFLLHLNHLNSLPSEHLIAATQAKLVTTAVATPGDETPDSTADAAGWTILSVVGLQQFLGDDPVASILDRAPAETSASVALVLSLLHTIPETALPVDVSARQLCECIMILSAACHIAAQPT